MVNWSRDFQLLIWLFLLSLPSPTVAQGVTNLRALTDQVKHLIYHLHQDLESHKRTAQKLSRDKVRFIGHSLHSACMDVHVFITLDLLLFRSGS